MFPSVKTRVASAARRGFDLAIEFATLGEYALAPDAGVGPRGEPASRAAPPHPPPVRPRPTRLKPATPAARRLQPPQQERRVSTRSGVRSLAFDVAGPHVPPRAGRKRAGAAGPRPQQCLVAEVGGRQP